MAKRKRAKRQQKFEAEYRRVVGQAIIDGLIKPFGPGGFGPDFFAADRGNYDQDTGDYTQSTCGSHTQGSGSYTQSC